MRKEILIIPDVHGRSFWKEAVDSKDYEKIIFLGDYTDPYEMEGITDDMAVDNFKSIIDYKQQNPDKVVLLLGNHDLHYYSEYYYELAGGVRYDPIAAITLQRLFQENSRLFQLAWETDWGEKHYLFSQTEKEMNDDKTKIDTKQVESSAQKPMPSIWYN
jgi:predicted MPP superfamily phosphohydrolase